MGLIEGLLGVLVGASRPSSGSIGPPDAFGGRRWGRSGPSWLLGPSWGLLGAVLGASWAIVTPLGESWGLIWWLLGRHWSNIEGILESHGPPNALNAESAEISQKPNCNQWFGLLRSLQEGRVQPSWPILGAFWTVLRQSLAVLGQSWVVSESYWATLENAWTLAGQSWRPYWTVLGSIGSHRKPPWAVFGSSWAVMGPSRGHFGLPWGHLGGILDRLGSL